MGENYRRGRFTDIPEASTTEDFASIRRANQIRKERDAGETGTG